jgi:hypothetical protein
MQGLAFLHQLTREMAEPVEQNNRVNVDYIPTQIVTEFLRDHSFSGSRPHGMVLSQSFHQFEYGYSLDTVMLRGSR